MAAGVPTPTIPPLVRGVLQAIPESARGAEEIRFQYRQAGICLQGLGRGATAKCAVLRTGW